MTGGRLMSEQWGQAGTSEFAGQPAANDSLTAGAMLHRAREAAGLHVGALAVALKVPVRKLEAMEDDRWDELTDAVFVRALALSICRTLKIDPQPVLQRLPQNPAPRLMHARDGLNTTFRAPGDGAAPSWFDQLTKPVFLAVLALLLGALALALLPSVSQISSLAQTARSWLSISTSSQPAASHETRVEPAAMSVSLTNIAQPVAAGTQPVSSPSAAASATGVPTAMPAVLVPASAAGADRTPVAGDPAAVANGTIVFRTSNPSWVEVTDAKGVVAVRRMLGAGDAAGASGALPLQVVIGRVDATQVQVRGKPFDLRPVTRDNVARFEVK
jgi:cytoskeleton protein RodZ